VFEIKDLSVKRDSHFILEKVSCEAIPGDLVAFSGSNGCGKTTLLNCIVGSIPESGGTVSLFGEPSNVSGDKISFIPDDGGIIPLLTIDEQLTLQCLLSGLSGDETQSRVDRIVGILELGGHREKRGSELSLGLKKRLGIGLGIIREAELFLFDEPFSGLDYSSVRVFCGILEAIRIRGKISVISSHSFPVEESLFTRKWVVRDRQILQNPEDGNTIQAHNLVTPEIPWLS
jgi:ABC-2 type transport system ATP-binding protein